MPRTGGGGFVLPAGNPVVTNTTIDATAFNNTMTDIGTALAGSIAADGQTAWQGNQNANGNRLTGLANASALSDGTTASDTQTGRLTYLTSVGGSANAITGSLPLMSGYTAGQSLRFIAANTNTGAATLTINGLGAAPITKNGTSPLVAGDIQAGTLITVAYDGLRFQLQSQGVGLSGQILQEVVFAVDAGGSTTSLTTANTSVSAKAITPKSTNSVIVIHCDFRATQSSLGGASPVVNFQLMESGAGFGVQPALTVAGATGFSVTVPASITDTRTNTALTTRSFTLGAFTNNAGAAAVAQSQIFTIREIQL